MDTELEFVLNELAQYLFTEKLRDAGLATYEKEVIQLDEKDKTASDVYSKFHKIETNNFWNSNTDQVFYEQAKLVENYEANYNYKTIHRNSYNPFRNCYTYKDFSFMDFKTYFTWRTKVRKGEIEPIDFDYHHIYINELLNKIGCKDAEDAIQKLISFWTEYRKYDQELDLRMPDVIKEFCIINTINKPYSEIINQFPIKVKLISKDLKDVNKGIYKEKLEFFSDISSYKIAKSKLLETKYGYILNECIEKIFLRLHQELEQKKISLPNMLIHKGITHHWWEPCIEYNVYEEIENKEFIFEGTEKYEYKNGSWSRTIYVSEDRYKNLIGYILKTMECYVREYLGYRKLKVPNKEDILHDYNMWYDKEASRLLTIYKMDLNQIIQSETIKCLDENKIPYNAFSKKKDEYVEQEEKVEVVFNKDEFAKIREKSEQIQKALIVEDAEEESQDDTGLQHNILKEEKVVIKDVAKPITSIDEQVSQESNVFKQFTVNLTKPEKEIIQVLLQKKDTENKMFQIAQEQNQMLEVMVSNINDKALETIGDTIIEADMSSIYEDYEKEIKEVL